MFTKGVIEGSSMGKYPRRNFVLSKGSIQTICFESFVMGVDLQVGNNSRTDREINMEVMKLLMDNME